MSKVKLKKARIKVYEIIVWYKILGFRMKVVGISMVVAIMIFNIIIGLGFLESHFRVFGWWRRLS